MTEKDYNEFLEKLASIRVRRIDAEPLEQMLDTDYSSTLEMIKYKVDNLTKEDYNNWSSYLKTGLFKEFDDKMRMACFCICIEASDKRRR